jgi:protocatechuate 3,4-dioxygenase beta subunit
MSSRSASPVWRRAVSPAFSLLGRVLLLTLMLASPWAMPQPAQAQGSVALTTPNLSIVQDGCTPSSLTGPNFPDPGDTVRIATTLTNNSGSSTAFRVLFRVIGTTGGTTVNRTVDLFYGGPTYMDTSNAGGTAWDDSYGQIVNTPLLANNATYTVQANFSVLRQQIANALNIAAGASAAVTVRVEVFNSDFTTYYGTASTSMSLKNTGKSACTIASTTAPGDSSPVLLTTNKTNYLSTDTIILEHSTIGADDVNKLPSWGDTTTATADIFRLVVPPTGNPETDYTNNLANLVSTITSWTANNTAACTRPCTATDERLPTPNIFNYSYQVGSGVQAFTDRASVAASSLTNNATYLVRIRPGSGSSSHPVHQPQWTYFTIGSPTAIGAASVGDRVFLDVNANGIQDTGESGLAGVTVRLYNSTGTLVATTTTDASGNYLFSGVGAGNYYLEFATPTGYAISSQDQGSNDANDSDASPTTGRTAVFALTSGQSDLTRDVGLYQPATIGNFVWNDLNANGVQDAGETGLAGVTVELYSGTTLVATTTTDASGAYSFSTPAGTYTVKFTKPTGYLFSPQDAGGNDTTDSDANITTGQTGSYTLTAGQTNSSVDAGLYQPASVGNFVWNDTNANGVQDAGEPGIAGTTVRLYTSSGTLVATTATDASGAYAFSGLTPGSYFVEFAKPTGYSFSPQDSGGNDATDSDANTTTGRTAMFALTAGQNNTIVDAGLYQLATIGDAVWLDRNANGIQESGEPGLAGVTVELYNNSNTLVATTTTDASGNYSFSVAAGTYSVKFIKPTGYTFSPQDAGGNDALDSDANTTPGQTGSYTLTAGQTNTTVDAGLYQPATVGNFVWNDLNNNGVQDAGEPGIAGATVRLYTSGGTLVASTTTDASGAYSFTNLAPGNYIVEFVAPAGYRFTGEDQGGNDATDSDADRVTGRTGVLSLTSGQTDNTQDAGLYQPATIGNFVWNDLNANGVQDAGEAGLANVTVELYSGSTLVASTTTDASGAYSFSVPAGSYTVKVSKPVGYSFSPQDAGGNDSTDSDTNTTTGQTATVVLTAGATNNTVDVGLYQSASVGDFVWNDMDSDGVQDADEFGVAGVTVRLYNSANTLIASTTTDASGNYNFSGLTPGSYLIEVVAPSGYSVSPQDQGGDDTRDNDANPATSRTALFTLTGGQTNTSVDVGLRRFSALGDFVWNDLDEDGIQDATEPGIAGVTVRLYDSSGTTLLATTTTDANGNYIFTGLTPGASYIVEFVAPAGFTTSPQDVGGNDELDSDVIPATGRTAAITLNPSGASNPTVDAGFFSSSGVIGDFVWKDLDGDGIQDAGETGLAGVTVRLYNGSGTLLSSTTTDLHGAYAFAGLAAGSYFVEFVAPTGYNFSPQDAGGNDATDSDANTTTGRTPTITLAAGETNATLDAGLYQNATIGDVVWNDANGNGLQDTGTAGLAGVTVRLYTSGGTLVATTTTDASGNYSFSAAPGSYFVEFVAPAGYSFSPQDAGSNDVIDSDANTTTGRSATFTVTSGQINNTVDAGLYRPATIGDLVWHDTNGNGIQDAGEPGVAGVTVRLYNNATNAVVATTTTDASGNYSFSVNAAGSYVVEIVRPSGYEFSPADQGGNDALDSDTQSQNGTTAPITVVLGNSYTTVDSGLYQPATIGNFVWEDLDGDGIQDADEAGLAGVTVSLYSGSTLVATTTTASDGSYSFSNLTPGSYAVQVTLPSGYSVGPQDQGGNDALDSDANSSGRTSTITVASGQTNNTLDIALYRPALIGDYVWNDPDGDGIQDLTESGLAGVTVRLYTSGGTLGASTTTDASGAYSFSAAPGSYFVEFVTPTGYVFTPVGQGNDAIDSDANPATGRTPTFIVTSGQTNTTLDAGLYQPSSIGDFIWHDTDGDGIQDLGEPGLAGVTVNLYDDTNTLIATTTTNASGNFVFTNLAPDQYVVEVVAPAGYRFSPKDQGAIEALDSNVNPVTGRSDLITLPAGTTYTNVDAGLYQGASLGNFVWNDLNNNGLQDAGEPGVAGVTVNLYDDLTNILIATTTTTTTASGNFVFTNLAPGSYYIGVVLPANMGFSLANQGSDDALDSDANPTSGLSSIVTLTSGETNTNLDVGLVASGVIGDFVWNDLNANGLQDAGEPGLAGVTVRLYDSTNTLVGTTTTDSGGSYQFQVGPGGYQVEFVAPAGYAHSPMDRGTDANLDSDVDPATSRTGTFVLPTGGVLNNVDAGFYQLAAVGDFAWQDTNGNGIQDAGEPGLAGVTVRLYTSGGTLVATTTTAADGSYAFTNLALGDYQLEFSAAGGMAFTLQDQGGNDALDSDVNPTTGRTAVFTLTASTSNFNLDAGLGQSAAIGDFVWYDADRDGVQDGAEGGISGVTLRLYRDDGDNVFEPGAGDVLVATTTTDATGHYLFANVPAGSYYVALDSGTLPAGLAATTGTSNPAARITLTSGQNDLSADFGYASATGSALGDRVWYDADADGVQDDGEVGIGGVRVFLDTDGDGNYDVGEPTAVTDADGTWLITNLPAGSYKVMVEATTLPAGYSATPTNGAISRTLQLPSGQDVLYADFGFNGGTPASISDTVFFDTDGDGTRDAGEPGIANVTVNLLGAGPDGVFGTADDLILASTATNASGNYSFVGLPTGNYRVQVTDQRVVLDDLEITTGGSTSPTITLAAGQNYTASHFGYEPAGSTIGGQFWRDLNGNGVLDAGEPVFSGVTVALWRDVNGDGVITVGTDLLLNETTSDVNGNYAFSELTAGDHIVDVTDDQGVMVGYTLTSGTAGSDNNSQSDPYAVTLTAGSPVNDTADFGYQASASRTISGIVFEDRGGNGIFDLGSDPTRSGIPMLLFRDLDGDGVLDPNEPLIATTTTDTSGAYSFTGLADGTYLVVSDADGTFLNGFFQTTQVATQSVQPITLNGANSTANNFGFFAPGGSATVPVTLASFQAVRRGSSTYFDWATATEVGNLGFNLYVKRGEALESINAELIPATVGDSLQAQAYHYVATGLTTGEVFFIADVDILGQSRLHGPFGLGEFNGERVQLEKLDWNAVGSEHQTLAERRATEARQQAEAQAKNAQVQLAQAQLLEKTGLPGAAEKLVEAATTYPAYNLTVKAGGIYRVSYESLKAAGLDLAGVPVDQLALENRGAVVPIHVQSAQPTFGPGAFIEFYGEGLNTLYTDANIYTLRVDASRARRVALDSTSAPTTVQPAPFYLDTVTVERNRSYNFSAPGNAPWYDTRMMAQTTPVTGSFAVTLDGYLAGAAPVRLNLEVWGGNDWPTTPDHHLVVRFNEVLIADARFDGLKAYTLDQQLPAGAARAGSNAIRLTLPGDSGTDADILYLNRYSVTYPRDFSARRNRLTFAAAGQAFRVTGLAYNTVVVYRLTNNGPVRLTGVRITGTSGAYQATFPGTAEPATYVVATSNTVLAPTLAPARPVTDITSGQAQYLALAHPDFIAGVQPLVEYHRSRGLSVRVVNVEDVYAQFGHSIFDPQAIRRYVAQAARTMGTQYVLLVGSDSYDYRNYLGRGAYSFLPSLYVATSDVVRFAPADPLLADVDANNVPDLAIGRFPVRTNAELDVLVAKTLAYGRKTYGGTAIFAADATETNGAFTAISEAMSQKLGTGWSVQRAYVDQGGVNTARTKLLNALNNGVALTNFVGHSSATRWTFANLFSATDATFLTNAGRPTVVTQWGCWNTYYTEPTYNTLGHKFLLSGDRGAAAVLGATALTEISSEAALGQLVTPRLVQPGMTIGAAVQAAKQELAASQPSLTDVLLGWTLLGDPALVVAP